nr:PREDICTED: protein artemis-like [Paralichthys olivaceus]
MKNLNNHRFDLFLLNCNFLHLILETIKSQQGAAPPVSVDELLPLSVSDAQPVARNYIDCTESNGEEEDDEEEEEEHEDQGDIKLMKEEVTQPPVEEENKMEGENKETPKWEDFFTAEMPTDSQNSHSQSCCSNATASPAKVTSSQTPELFSDDEEEETPENHEAFSLTLSASLSNHSSQNMDSCFSDTLILQRERGDAGTNAGSQKKEEDGLILQSEPEELSQSQASSDFDIPCTPESKPPRPDELSQLYQTLASGDEDVIRYGSKGFA